jgi:subtilisin family serine protease
MAVRLTQAEAAQLARLNEVAFVEREKIEHIDTDTGPLLIGADKVWDGSATGGATNNMGEGVIIGVIDTGINSDHASFADIGGDGYDHTNPWGEGVYAGDCATDFSELCNDKLIGIHHYAVVTDAYLDVSVFGDTPPPANGEDYDSHGSHTAGTSGGNVLKNVPLLNGEFNKVEGDGINNSGFEFSQISGVAPHANIIAYQICWPGGDGDTYSGCPGSATLSAIEDAIKDGVDVINYSISGGGDPWESSSEMGFLAAREAGIFVATSAGNDGPAANTTDKSAPWYTAVGASTHGRSFVFEKDIGSFTGGNSELPTFVGENNSGGITASIVYAGNFENPNDPNGDSAQCLQAFPEGTFNGQIVVCDRGEISRTQKAINAYFGGAGGFVLANMSGEGESTSVDSDHYVLPGIHINAESGTLLREWLATGEGHGATIGSAEGKGELVLGGADHMGDFSSRGPNSAMPDIMSPSVAAPGVDIYAATADQQFGRDGTTPQPSDFGMLSGTSMASPHTAGAAAILKSAYPTWTADQVRSALMLTATHAMLQPDGETDADAFNMGAGRIRVDQAALTGLVMNETGANYRAANPAEGGDPKTLNIPSMSNASCVGNCSWTRTVTATKDGSWTSAGVSISEGLVINVSPATFDITAGSSQEITVTVDAIGAVSDVWSHGHVVLTSEAHPTAQLPVNVIASSGNIPKRIKLNANRNLDHFLLKDIMAVEITEFTSRSYGLSKAMQTEYAISEDSDNSSAYDDLEDGVTVTWVTVPEGAKRFVAEVLKSDSPDLDMFVGMDADGDGVPTEAEEVGRSATGTALERVDISEPVAGSYFIITQNWQSSGDDAVDAFTLATAVVDGELGDNLSTETDAAIPALTAFDISIKWDLDDATQGDVFYGAMDIGTSAETAGNLGLVAIDLIRGVDDVTISNDSGDALLATGDTINYSLSVKANFTPEDRVYNLQAMIPADLTLDESSLPEDVTVSENMLTWNVTQVSLFGTEPSYAYSTNVEDASCEIPDYGIGGGYHDLSSIGYMPSALDGDTQSGAFSVPVKFLGKTYETINVTDDGFIYFGGAQGQDPWVNQLLPNEDEANNLVAPFWRDWQLVSTVDADGNESGVTVQSFGEDLTFVEFDNMHHYDYVNGDTSVSDTADFEVVFDNGSGIIYFAYDNVTHTIGDSLGQTVGYENAQGKSGHSAIYSPYLGGAGVNIDSVNTIQSGLTICYTPVPVPDQPTVLNFSAVIMDDFAGGSLNVALTSSLNGGAEVTAASTTGTVSVEGAPVAMATAVTVDEDTENVIVDASISTDPNGDTLNYEWLQVGGTPVDFIVGDASISFTAPNVTVETVLWFQLTVDDGKGNSDTTTVSVTVVDTDPAPRDGTDGTDGTNGTNGANGAQGKKGSGSMGMFVLLTLPLLWMRRRVKK